MVKPIGQLVAAAGLAFFGLAGLSASQPAQAFTFYTGVQTVFLPSAPPPSGAALTARNNFVTAATPLGTVGTENFETPAVNNPFYTNATGNGSLNYATSGITVQVTNGQIGGSNNGISNTNGFFAIGHNTTSGGSRLLRIAQQTGMDLVPPQTSVTFSFGTPLQAFGLYITDYGDSESDAVLEASINGTAVTGFPQTIPQSPGNFFSGRSVQFLGFTAASTDPAIASITFQFSGVTTEIDRLGMDDIRFVQVPVPPQFVGTALMAMFAAWKARRSRKSKPSSSPVG
ncbi:MAG: hypothetical protein KME35_18010 [Aphanocapsa sp. GSE-SYN-MK-11-07L]|jgi:hypothetical protein|nr:hypothetical protein [Aphanocapsa sp. GSE-SYN-MK-11-07L]